MTSINCGLKGLKQEGLHVVLDLLFSARLPLKAGCAQRHLRHDDIATNLRAKLLQEDHRRKNRPGAPADSVAGNLPQIWGYAPHTRAVQNSATTLEWSGSNLLNTPPLRTYSTALPWQPPAPGQRKIPSPRSCRPGSTERPRPHSPTSP